MCRFGIALLSVVAAPLFAAELSGSDTAALLKTLQEQRVKTPTLTAEFTEEKTTHLLTKPITSRGTITFQAPDKFRRELTGNSPSTTVSNGQKLWIYYPAFKEAELYTLGQRQAFDDAIAALTAGLNFDHIADFYRIAAFAEPEGHRVELTPKSAGLKRMVTTLTVTLDTENRVRKIATQLPKGDRVVTTYSAHRTAPVAANTFEFTPPSDAHISQPLGK